MDDRIPLLPVAACLAFMALLVAMSWMALQPPLSERSPSADAELAANVAVETTRSLREPRSASPKPGEQAEITEPAVPRRTPAGLKTIQQHHAKRVEESRAQALTSVRDQTADFAYDAVLDPSEQDSLEAIRVQERERTWEIVDATIGRPEAEPMEERFAQIREETDSAAQGLLDDGQFALYMETFRD
jgi:type II secretory pathway component PulM